MENEDLIQSKYLKVIREKTCIGKNVWVYKLLKDIDDSLINFLKENNQITYPLGEKYNYFIIQSTGKYVISGIKGTNEIKVVPRLTANSDIRINLENSIINFLENLETN